MKIFATQQRGVVFTPRNFYHFSNTVASQRGEKGEGVNTSIPNLYLYLFINSNRNKTYISLNRTKGLINNELNCGYLCDIF